MGKKKSNDIHSQPSSKANPSSNRATIVGKPLSSTSHSLQLLLFLILQPILISICVLILPQGILHSLPSLPSLPKSLSMFSSVSSDPIQSTSSTLNQSLSQSPIHGIQHLLNGQLGSVPRRMWLGLQGTCLVQAWWTAAIKGWIRKDDLMRRGDREGLRKLSKRSRGEMLEQITLTALCLPFAVLTMSFLILLLGSPWTTFFNKSLSLSIHLTLIALFLPIHLYGLPSLPDWLEKATAVNVAKPSNEENQEKKEDLDEEGWTRVFARGSPTNATDAIPLVQMIGVFTGAWIANAGMALDWGKPWQDFPVPPILGSVVGLALANLVCFIGFLGDW